MSSLSDDMMAEAAEVMSQTLAMLPAHTMQAVIVKALMLNDDNVKPCDCLQDAPGEEEWNIAVAFLVDAQRHARTFRRLFVAGVEKASDEAALRTARDILKGGNSPETGR